MTYPLFHPAREVAASSTSGKSVKNRGITKTIESRPWSKPNRKPPIHATSAHPMTKGLAKISLMPIRYQSIAPTLLCMGDSPFPPKDRSSAAESCTRSIVSGCKGTPVLSQATISSLSGALPLFRPFHWSNIIQDRCCIQTVSIWRRVSECIIIGCIRCCRCLPYVLLEECLGAPQVLSAYMYHSANQVHQSST